MLLFIFHIVLGYKLFIFHYRNSRNGAGAVNAYYSQIKTSIIFKGQGLLQYVYPVPPDFPHFFLW